MLIVAGIAVIATGFLAAHQWQLRASFPTLLDPFKASGEDESPARAPARQAVTALGRLEPEGEVIEVSAPTGDRLGTLPVKEGQTVQAGEVLAYLESHAERVAEREWIASQLGEARARLKAETAHGEALIREAEIAVKKVDEVQRLEIQGQEAKVRMLQDEHATAAKDLSRVRSLSGTGAATTQEFEKKSTQVTHCKEELCSAQAVCDRLKVAREINLLQARAQLRTAQANLAKVTSAIPIDSLQKNLLLAEHKERLTVIRAPRQGQILRILTRPGEATGVKPILRLGNTGQMIAVAEIYETDVRYIQIGQKAEVSGRALTGTLTGTVAQIGWLIYKNDVLHVDPTANNDARVVEVRIKLDQSEPVARLTNMQVDIRVLLGRQDNQTPVMIR